MRIYRKSTLIANAIGRKTIAIAPILGLAIAFGASTPVQAHPGHQRHAHILKAPLAGVRNNYWYDYQSDVLEAENELRKDLRRAKTTQDRREAWEEYNREIKDARHDYTKEMAERGYIRPGQVTVGG
ncbi:hypothetical protein ACFOWX_08900 [Sphingorhabdus arenilitoris]|uniref:DUF4148 domain-containing protein n=1 Tax=Sphingorhabdus arenilitoris TaxID=1490041 RepID=A0ABV8RIL7_9SPHN